MRIGTTIDYTQSFDDAVEELVRLEDVGLQMAAIPEAYSFDAVSQLGYLAARTRTAQLTSSIMQLYPRTPTLTAMTAAGLDLVSSGRFTLGLGASGPQVIEGFHGVPFDAPVGRAREVVEICRKVWRREPLVHQGRHYQIPLPADRGTGLGKPLKLISRPLRDRIPIALAAMGPRNVALAAEVAESWQPLFFHPGRSDRVWSEPLARGLSRRDPELGRLDIMLQVGFSLRDNARALDTVRDQIALYVGGMGHPAKNFYHQLACRYGYETQAHRIQELFAEGKRREAARAVPDDLARAVSLIGEKDEVMAQLVEFARAGVTTLMVTPMAHSPQARLTEMTWLIEQAALLEEPTSVAREGSA